MTEEQTVADPVLQHKRLGLWLVALVVVLGVVYMLRIGGVGRNVANKDTYQAVFLSNGQVYFGKLKSQSNWLVLEDIYYLQVTQQLQPAGDADAKTPPATQPNIQLVKLGSELHGPEDAMHIDKDKILFWENMKTDSKVMQAIQQYKDTKK